LILRKIIKIVAPRFHILRLKCTRFDFGPQTPLRELTALPQTPYLDLRGPTSKGREGTGEEGRGGERKKGREEGCPGFKSRKGGNPRNRAYIHQLMGSDKQYLIYIAEKLEHTCCATYSESVAQQKFSV